MRASGGAGIPGVAGRLGVPANAINFLEEGGFFFRVSAKKIIWGILVVFFSPFGGVFVLFGGVFAFLGVFL